MTAPKDTGGPAFPCDSREARGFCGMSLLDYFAGQALAGFCANSDLNISASEMAEWCYRHADSMLAQRGVDHGAR